MAYYITKGGYTINEDKVIVPMQDYLPLYQDYLVYLAEMNPLIDTDYETPEEIKDKILIIRKEYSDKISGISGMQEAIERKLIDGTEIPKSILDERETLKAEYKTMI